MRNLYHALLASGLLFTSPLALAQGGSSGEIEELKAQLATLMNRIEELERQATAAPPAEEPAPTVVQATSVSEWPERIRLSGDLRYRHESINDDASAERSRHRMRARLGLEADVTDDLEIGFVLSTGGDNPISGNQSLDGGLSRKDIGFDRAFFAWDLADNLTLRGGKMGNPFFRPAGHHLIFDGDLNPEGLAMRYDNGNFFSNFAGYFIDERSGTDDDALMLAAQGGFRGEFGTNGRFTAGFSYYDHSNLRGFEPLFDNIGRGNQLDANGNFLYEFDVAELFAEATFHIGDEPLRLFADVVKNTSADAYDEGYAFGARYRSVSEPGDWDVSWVYEDLEANAVFALFTDSDFAGGGTDGKGHIFRGNYRLRDRLNLRVTYFLNERGMASGFERDYKRLQADISFSY